MSLAPSRCLYSTLSTLCLCLLACGGSPTVDGIQQSASTRGGTKATSTSTNPSAGGATGIFTATGGSTSTTSTAEGGAAGTTNSGTLCGNSILDDNEGCDDGNALSGDGCDGTCKVENGYSCSTVGAKCQSVLFCGDGLPGPDESCDDKNKLSGDGCSSSCTVEPGFACSTFGVACTVTTTLPVCGNNVTESGETCDDGGTVSGDGCSAACKTETGYTCNGNTCNKDVTCGNGILNSDEQCDDGNLSPGDCCNGRCQLENNCKCSNPPAGSTHVGQVCVSTIVCGDGKVTGDEACDDGNQLAGDGCSKDCSSVEPGYTCPSTGGTCGVSVVLCPNARIDPGEECDDGNSLSGDGCSANCKIQAGYVCPTAGALCQRKEYCGNGLVSYTMGESCDDGGTTPNDGCSATCTLEAGYTCDNSAQPSICTFEVCGNGRIMAGETCDDKNTNNADGCSSTCRIEPGFTCPVVGTTCRAICGDKLTRGTEQCDDGNPNNGDGCSARCQLEPGYVCDSAGVCRKTVCADGIKEGLEECDDGNTRPYDACSPTCTLEPVCGSATSPVGKCASRCGDGILLSSAGEQCDDGNGQSGDGCSSDCKLEPGYDCITEPTPATIQIPIVYRDFKAFSKWQGPGKTNPVGHPDFERTTANYTDGFPVGSETGILTTQLGVDRKPIYNGTDAVPPGGANAETSGKVYFDQWFRDNIGTDASGAPINMRIDDTLTLGRMGTTGANYSMDSRLDSPWSGLGGFFPLDGRGFGNEGSGSSGTSHNYRFTSELRLWFEYKGNEKLEFSGDDDVWVFVNGTLAVDLGGIHCRQYGVMQLDTAGHGSSCVATASCTTATTTCTLAGNTDFAMTTGNIYEAVVFQAERHVTESNYWLTLNNFLTGKTQCHPICGDAIATPDEACDLGTALNTGAYGGCTALCTLAPYCGDSHIDTAAGETCDDGKNVNVYGSLTSGCGPGCRVPPYCGDSKVDFSYGETCDKGSANSDAAYGPNTCSGACNVGPFCGDGSQDQTEACDDGQNNGGPSSSCDQTCALKCGNAKLDPGEQCDLGASKNTGAYGGCKANCTLSPYCGDGIKQASLGEACDDGRNDGTYGTCSALCQLAAYCGDGKLDAAAGEKCDKGAANQAAAYGPDICTTTCQPAPYCGDHAVNAANGEACDDGSNNSNTVAGACKLDCAGYLPPPSSCGNGQLDTGEQCDNGPTNGTPGDACDGRCKFKCGNGIKDSGEQCDNGINDGSYGTCNHDCTLTAYCGDSVKNGPEQCDLGPSNVASSPTLYGPEYCTTACTRAPYCGDGRVNFAGEQCDGQTGCNPFCRYDLIQ